MKKEDSSKTPEALTAQKELNAYVQRKIQIMELETNSIVDQAKQEITKEISLRKEDIIKTIEERNLYYDNLNIIVLRLIKKAQSKKLQKDSFNWLSELSELETSGKTPSKRAKNKIIS